MVDRYCENKRLNDFEEKICPKDNIKFKYVNGYQYKGDFDNNLNGKSYITFHKGKTLAKNYEGEIKNGNPDGKGVKEFVSGEKFVGSFIDGLKDGYGRFIDRDGMTLQGYGSEGIWLSGKFVDLHTPRHTQKIN